MAHHAGRLRPHALHAPAGPGGGRASLGGVGGAAPRPSRFVVPSDHGQSQGSTFRQLSGRTLEETVTALVGASANAVAATGDIEAWGPVNALVSDVLHASSRTSRWAERRSEGADGSGVLVGP